MWHALAKTVPVWLVYQWRKTSVHHGHSVHEVVRSSRTMHPKEVGNVLDRQTQAQSQKHQEQHLKRREQLS